MNSLTASKMPGSYFPDFDYSTRPSLHLTTVGARPPLFVPPRSPSATTSLSKSHSPNLEAASNGDAVSRKRLRHNDYTSTFTLTPQQTKTWTKIETPFAQSPATDCPIVESPAAFVNTIYRIAGGLDTPLAAKLDAEERQEENVRELDYRPNRMTLAARQVSGSYFPQIPATAVSGGHVGGKRAHSTGQSKWGESVVNLVGGVAGKVFNFCWNGAFRGFRAGRGRPYSADGDTPAVVEQSTLMDIGEKDDVFNEQYEAQHYHHTTPVPGQFPDEGFIDDYMSQPQAYRANQVSTPVPHGDGGRSTLRCNWVLVDNTDAYEQQRHSPLLSALGNPRKTHRQRRPVSIASLTASGHRPRLVSCRPSLAGSLGSNVKRPASFASPRASPGRSCASETESHDTGSVGHRRSRSSMASPRRKAEGELRHSFTTPTSPDVQKFEKKIRRKERKEDENLQRVNRRLQDMIKEAKEALGTRIEVGDDQNEDEGYGEGTEMMGASKW